MDGEHKASLIPMESVVPPSQSECFTPWNDRGSARSDSGVSEGLALGILTFGSQMAMAGDNPFAIQKAMGAQGYQDDDGLCGCRETAHQGADR